MRQVNQAPAYRETVQCAAAALRVRDYVTSRAGIADAMLMDMDAPEPHNLLGILYEFTGDPQSARRHYRAAYALDPTYKPACRNLERLSAYGFSPVTASVDFGLDEATGTEPEPANMVNPQRITG